MINLFEILNLDLLFLLYVFMVKEKLLFLVQDSKLYDWL